MKLVYHLELKQEKWKALKLALNLPNIIREAPSGKLELISKVDKKKEDIVLKIHIVKDLKRR